MLQSSGFKPVDPKITFSELEERLIAFWKENKTFEKSISNRSADKKWTFLDGSPFVTGMPHYGSLLSSLPKDVFGRYFTMKGYQVRRVWGWDGHGLPIENKVEGELQIQRKKDIEEKIGVKTFIERCLYYVNQVSSEWEWYVDHIGRWVDFKNAYKTWDMPYMESVMWVFKQMYEKNLIYKGFRVSLYCPHCVTPISNFEVAMDADNYKEIVDASTIYKYLVEGEVNTYFLAWSTTPWTKISTTVLAINPNLTYVKVKQGEEYYILAKATLKMLSPRHSREGGNPGEMDPRVKPEDDAIKVQNDNADYEIIEELKGSDLVGKKFVPHYDYYKNNVKPEEKVFEIVGADYVSADEGTGIVTIAVYGEEDLKVMQEQHVYKEINVDEEGMILPHVPIFGGMYYLKANKAVNADLAARGLIYEDKEISHRVPLCWRCHTRLYYAPMDAWYVNVQTLKPRMKELNEDINWFPNHFKHGRFLKSLENAPDWNISRNRYWGSPVPVWECECGERFVPGSVKELEERSGYSALQKTITNLHKPDIDEVTITCAKCSKEVHRVPEVLDSWIEAGSASFAERHFPFEIDPSTGSGLRLKDFFPPDYIAEYTGQIRAWFYVLHVIGTALYDSKAFKNVSVTGVILGTDGRKMSKNFKNYPDPKEMLQKYGGDALRLYLLGSPVMNGEDILISEEQYKNQVRGTMLILWNVYNFFVMNANVDNWAPLVVASEAKQSHDEVAASTSSPRNDESNILDQWILSLLAILIENVTTTLDTYDTVAAIEHIKNFVNDLSTWYVRRSRDRVGSTAEDQDDKNAFYSTTYTVLTTVCQLLAPLAPFISEEIYRNLTGEESVHLTDWPVMNGQLTVENEKLIEDMKIVRKIVEAALSKRKEAQIKVKQPLSKLKIVSGVKELSQQLIQLIKDEVNIKEEVEIVLNPSEINIFVSDPGGQIPVVELDTNLTPELIAEGKAREIVRSIQEKRKELQTTFTEQVDVTVLEIPAGFEEYIKKRALVRNVTQGDTFAVTKV